MIELGKYGTDFVVNKSYWYNKLDKPEKHLRIHFEMKECIVKEIYNDSVVLQLLSNNQEDCITIYG